MGEVAVKPLDFVANRRQDIAKISGGMVDIDRFVKSAQVEIASNPKLMDIVKTTRGQMSAVDAILKMASLGLEVGSIYGYGYLLPYGDKINFQLGYKGLLKIAYRSNKVKNVSAKVVYHCDVLEIEEGDNPRLVHKPNLKDRKIDDKPYVYYCVVTLSDDSRVFTYLTREEILDIEKKTRKGQQMQATWVQWFDEMAKKTVILRALKHLDLGANVNAEIAREFDNRPVDTSYIDADIDNAEPMPDLIEDEKSLTESVQDGKSIFDQ